ncbi:MULTISPECIES: TldD/PmbA family protein [Aminobacterium]|jgi:PmbA protein|uniref:Peptidase U62 modulator of DNA gyrase n=1 Tax=Aminobacterium colombiense (strain DSM 12261 / ALA-1) TaxID=572547 RepID=D5ED04_AMICL|nr:MULTISPECIES: TldD/PmbA family protein [Aminobacterium]MDD2379614.1 TldD/PmbA family protein [Aminobacterium colombiense]ADE56436.1 peptidase U62 modulator of DNA gyrase [Aminobacterium colombiense DSM 12261]MDD3768128.1 TldD/PmbA family protein [Aminobacterium colombiense]MDD4265986.1 TldD/PmbA family protein [Aminobacterium colombiense]MDD4586424.1 TldD/PmbA family protein [Aminobacterium colombiense]
MIVPDRDEVESYAELAIKEALEKGACGADILFYFGSSHSLSLRDEKPEQNNSGFSVGVGIRTLDRDGRQGVAHINTFNRSSLQQLVEWSWHNCANLEPDPWTVLYNGKSSYAKNLELKDEKISAILPEQRQEWCAEMTHLAKKKDSRVLSVRSASWNDGEGATFYMASTGVKGWYDGSGVAAGLSLVMSDGVNMEMGGYGEDFRFLEDISLQRIVEKAVTQTACTLGGRPIQTKRYTLVLSPEVSASLLSVIGELFCASNVHKNRSLYKGKLGKKVASPLLSLVDDGLMPRKLGTVPFDGEGVPSQRTVLMKEGIVEGYLYNLKHAQKDGVESTGNAARSISSLPDVDISNFYMEPGNISSEEIFVSVQSGIYITEFLGLHTVNPVSGDFSLGIKGVSLSGGLFAQPVAGMTIAGNLLDLLNRIVFIGNDLSFFGDTGGCTMVIDNVTAAGL